MKKAPSVRGTLGEITKLQNDACVSFSKTLSTRYLSGMEFCSRGTGFMVDFPQKKLQIMGVLGVPNNRRV